MNNIQCRYGGTLGKLKQAADQVFREVLGKLGKMTIDGIGLLLRRFIPVRRDTYAFATIFSTYGCNPKYIDLELRKRHPDAEIIWLASEKKKIGTYPPHVRVVPLMSLRGILTAYSSEYWIDNGVVFSDFFMRKSNQVHIQTMHGSLGIKRLDNAIASRKNRWWHGRQVIRRESELTDCVMTNSRFEEDVFRGAFWKNVPLLRLGHARTDILFDVSGETRSRIRQKLLDRCQIPVDVRIALFAPTHRASMTASGLEFDFTALRQRLSRKFGGDFVLLVRFHNKSKSLACDVNGDSFVFNVTDYPDMQELIAVTDVGITDYSSWIFDYVVTGRPGFIFATDVDKYAVRTGFCYPLEETPFPVAHAPEELLENVDAFDAERYARRVKDFLADKECVDDGHSAERAVDWLDALRKERMHG